MRVLVYSDLQAGESTARLFSDPSVSLQLYRVRKFYRDIADVIVKHKCRAVWDLGDTTDDRNAIPISVVDAVLEGIDRLPQSDLNIKLIGNHEQLLRSGDIHVGRMFDRKFRVVDRVETFHFGKLTVICCAFPANDSDAAAWLVREMAKYPEAVVLGHFQVIGSAMPSGSATTGLPRSIFAGVKLALLGHVHRFQEVAPNVFYVGSPFQQDHGESEDAFKRVAIVDTDTLKVEWVELTGYPTHTSVGYSDFISQAQDTEDRFRVVLRNHTETEAFYSHPLASRAEPVYEYGLAEGQGSGQSESSHNAETSNPSTWSLDDAMAQYVKERPPGELGVQISDDDMISIGKELAGG